MQQSTTTIEKFNTTWFQRKAGVSPMKAAVDNANKKDLTFVYGYEESQSNYLFGAYKTQNDFIKALMTADSNNRRFHEVIVGACKTFADIEWEDMSLDKQDIIDTIEAIVSFAIDEMFGDSMTQFWWSDSSGPSKGSLHLIVETDGKMWRNTSEQKLFWDVIKAVIHKPSLIEGSSYDCLFYMKSEAVGLVRKCVIDYGVYTKNRQFRTIYSRKCGSNRVLIPEMEGMNDKYLVCCKVDAGSRFYEIPDNIKSKFAAPAEYDTTINITDIEHIINSNVMDVCITERVGCLIKLKTIGQRKCIINGEENSSDNCFCVIKSDGIYFKCHDEGCKGQSKKIHSFEIKNLLPQDIRDFDDYIKLRDIENLTDAHIREFIQNNIVFITGNNKPFYMIKKIQYGSESYDSSKVIEDNIFGVEVDGEYKKLKSLIETYRYDYSKKAINYKPYNETLIHEKQLHIDENIFNLFRGFKATYYVNDEYEIDYSKINPILDHIKEVWCKNIEEQFDYVMNWIAHLVQKPASKTKTVLFLKSAKQGAGKDIIWEFIAEYVMGRELVGYLNDINQLTTNFNNSLCFKQLTICDELPTFTGTARNSDKLKNLITQSVIRMEQKGIDAINVDDYNNYVMLSNNDYAVHIEAGDRRYFTLELDNKYVGNVGYFENIGKTCLNQAAGDVMYNYLMRRDISEFHPETMPQTTLKRELKTHSMPKSLLYIENLFNSEDSLTNQTAVHKAALFSSFTKWLSDEGYNNKGYNAKRFGSELKLIDIEFTRLRIGGLLKLGTRLDKDIIEAAFKSYLKDPEYKFTVDDDFEIIEESESEDL